MKTFLNIILDLVLLFAIVLLTGVIGLRIVLSSDNIANISKAIVDPSEDKKELSDFIFEDIDDKEEIIKYMDNKEFKDAFGDVVHQFIMIKVGVQEGKIDTTKMRTYLEKIVKEYNKEHDTKITDEDIDKLINNIQEQAEEEKADEALTNIFNFIYSKMTTVLSVLVIAIAVVSLYFINKKINTPLLLVGSNMIIAALLMFGLVSILNGVSGDQEMVDVVKDVLISPLKIISYVELVFGILFIVLSKKIKDNNISENKEEVTS